MKVMCIKQGDWTQHNSDRSDPAYGDICTVVRQFENIGHQVYELKEFPHKGGYSVKGFVPLSDIDETEFVRETLKQPT